MGIPFLRRLATIAFVLAGALALSSGALAQTPAASAGGKGPDILGIRTGMTPQEAYNALMAIDPAHRVTVGQIPIPALLGDKSAVYAMAPENLNTGGDGTISVAISLPPNPQQVFVVHRQLINSIHTTVDPILASLRQKYGPESTPMIGAGTSPALTWLYDEQGQLANPATAANSLKYCGNTGMTLITIANFPLASLVIQPGVLTSPYAVNGFFPIPPIQDPSKNPECQGMVVVRAGVTGGQNNGVYNYSLDVTITAYGIEKRAAVALSGFLGNVAAKKQQQDLNKAKQQSVPTL